MREFVIVAILWIASSAGTASDVVFILFLSVIMVSLAAESLWYGLSPDSIKEAILRRPLVAISQITTRGDTNILPSWRHHSLVKVSCIFTDSRMSNVVISISIPTCRALRGRL